MFTFRTSWWVWRAGWTRWTCFSMPRIRPAGTSQHWRRSYTRVPYVVYHLVLRAPLGYLLQIVCGNGLLQIVCGNGLLQIVCGNGLLQIVCGNGLLQIVCGNGLLQIVCGNGLLQMVCGNGLLQIVCGNGLLQMVCGKGQRIWFQNHGSVLVSVYIKKTLDIWNKKKKLAVFLLPFYQRNCFPS